MSENIALSGREFTLGEPTTGHVLAILNVIGKLGMRAERLAASLMSNPSSRAMVFGLLAAMTPDDLVKFGIAVLQVDEKDKETRQFIEANLRVAPLVAAFISNVRQSSDLAESLQNFFGGTTVLAAMFQNMNPGVQATVSPPTDQPNMEPAQSS